MELKRAKVWEVKGSRKRQRANSKNKDLSRPSIKKAKQDWRIPTEEEEEEKEVYERFLTAFINKHGRLPNSSDEDP